LALVAGGGAGKDLALCGKNLFSLLWQEIVFFHGKSVLFAAFSFFACASAFSKSARSRSPCALALFSC
jgi:hypothetical protein